ncbi:hypothetical protein Desor_0954 [Desulfosporosinus orientis DSM 765]|uniref:Uncharacterized protein n=1 Tax=Desulfosporosinus orientis (strain ATCC 19365 / DSM 765 / NCIMB 8382 / VKM B-1628 / Singapore I) TaxID=768706 RepID=G7W5I3_DESOD|nr:hypothetical protein [Desulfosporosinus orientis]AET66630.1 hypothetical protein Desor_0954 [Desulfosporosinus orientis DSM 765]
MSEEDLRDKIRKEILKSGFPLELYCQQKVLDYNWSINMNKQYQDKDDNFREIDIEAHKQDMIAENLRLSTRLIIECKKNHSNPWVFFREKTHGPIMYLTVAGDIDESGKENFFWRHHYKETVLEHHYKTTTDKSRAYVVPFKHDNPKENRQIYESVSSVINYYKHHGLEKIRTFDRNFIKLFYFVVVYDGKLFMADVINGEDVHVEDTSHVLLGVSNVDGKRTRHYTVDIVTKEFFGEYLKILENDGLLTAEYALSIHDKKLDESLLSHSL